MTGVKYYNKILQNIWICSQKIKTKLICILDVPNNLDIKGPRYVDAGEKITIECGASKHKYNNNIKWNHQTLNNENTSIFYKPYLPYRTNYIHESEFNYWNYQLKSNYNPIIRSLKNKLKRMKLIFHKYILYVSIFFTIWITLIALKTYCNKKLFVKWWV